jgi:hypothetical protein
MRRMVLCGVFICGFLSLSTAQLSIDDIDLERVSQRKIRSYLHMQRERDVHFLSDLKASNPSGKAITDWFSMKNCYQVKASLDELWDVYLNTNLSEAWEGRMVSFGLLISRWNDWICYRNENYESAIDTGQVFFVNLRIMGGLVNLPVGLEIVKVDNSSHTIIFSYLEGNTAQGEQVIEFRQHTDGYTEIIHTANFKSPSDFRDKHLYPPFHTKAINEFHERMAAKVVEDVADFIVL